jgi:hypothetical protein
MYWHAMAQKLRAAAKVIQREIETGLEDIEAARYEDGTTIAAEQAPGIQLWPAFGLLAAFALENLLKGILIWRSPELVLENRLDKSLTTHKLLPLALRAGFALDVVDAYFLEAATEHSTWAGKYHIPKHPPGAMFTIASSDANFAAFDKLYSAFEAELNKAGRPRLVYRVIGPPPRRNE